MSILEAWIVICRSGEVLAQMEQKSIGSRLLPLTRVLRSVDGTMIVGSLQEHSAGGGKLSLAGVQSGYLSGKEYDDARTAWQNVYDNQDKALDAIKMVELILKRNAS